LNLTVQVHPGSSKKEALIKQDTLHVYIHAHPEAGKANKETIEVLSKYFKVPKSKILLINGEKSRVKIFSIPDDYLSASTIP
jgi:hypothetical protein